MKNNRYYGIVFQKGNDCGIAKITVLDTTTNMWITSTGVSSTNPQYRLYDTYAPTQVYVGGTLTNINPIEKVSTYLISVEKDHNYSIIVENSGTYNASAASPYNINILRYLEYDPWTNSSMQTTAYLWDSNYPTEVTSYVLSEDNIITKTKIFNGDGTTTSFVLSGSYRAQAPYRFSVDGGSTWLYPWAVESLTWGSNAPNYNDELIDSTGYYGVKFDIAPGVAYNNVIVEFYIRSDSMYINRELFQPYYETITDYCNNINILDDATELY